MTRKIFGWLAIWKGVLVVVSIAAILFLPLKPDFTAAKTEVGSRQPYLLSSWANFDGVHYLKIALRGYEPLTQPFFPLFPVTVALFSHLTTLPVLYSALFLNHLFFFLALLIVWQLFKKDGIANPITGIILILAYPTSFYYGATYNDALFFLCASSCILAARNKAWLLASVCATAATLTRLNGLALAPFLAWEYLTTGLSLSKSWQMPALFKKFPAQLQLKEIWRSKIGSGLFIVLGFLGYLAYIQFKFGNWRTLFTTMAIWQQSQTTFPLRVVWRYLKILWLHSPLLLNYWVAVVELLAVIFSLFLLIWSWKKIRSSYWLFFAISLLIPSLTGTFQGMPRYALHLYPFFLSLILFWRASNRLTKITYLLFCLIIFVFGITLFTRGYFFS